jgi:hypothetical protein
MEYLLLLVLQERKSLVIRTMNSFVWTLVPYSIIVTSNFHDLKKIY